MCLLSPQHSALCRGISKFLHCKARSSEVLEGGRREEAALNLTGTGRGCKEEGFTNGMGYKSRGDSKVKGTKLGKSRGH